MPVGKPISDEIKLKILKLFKTEKLSHKTLANRFHLHRDTVNKILVQFRKEGKL